MFEINNVDIIACAKKERRHFRVPIPSLMSKMHTSLQHHTHADFCHFLLLIGLSLHASRATTRFKTGHPAARVDACVDFIAYKARDLYHTPGPATMCPWMGAR